MAKPLRSQLNQIRAWVRQGRTDAWIAHQLEVSTTELREFRRRHELERRRRTPASRPARRDRGRDRGRDPRGGARRRGGGGRGAEDDDDDDDEREPDASAADSTTARTPTNRGAGGAGAAAAAASAPAPAMQATFDHGEEGYGLWLDPAVEDDPVYSEHWAGHRRVEVTIEPDRIVISRSETAARAARDSSDCAPTRRLGGALAQLGRRPAAPAALRCLDRPVLPGLVRDPGELVDQVLERAQVVRLGPLGEQPAHPRVADRGRGVLEQEDGDLARRARSPRRPGSRPRAPTRRSAATSSRPRSPPSARRRSRGSRPTTAIRSSSRSPGSSARKPWRGRKRPACRCRNERDHVDQRRQCSRWDHAQRHEQHEPEQQTSAPRSRARASLPSSGAAGSRRRSRRRARARCATSR